MGFSRTKLNTLLCLGEGRWGLGGRSSLSLSLVCLSLPISPPGELGLTDSLELVLSGFHSIFKSSVDSGVISTPESGVVRSKGVLVCGRMRVEGSSGSGEGGGGKSFSGRRDCLRCIPGKNWLVGNTPNSKGRAVDVM